MSNQQSPAIPAPQIKPEDKDITDELYELQLKSIKALKGYYEDRKTGLSSLVSIKNLLEGLPKEYSQTF